MTTAFFFGGEYRNRGRLQVGSSSYPIAGLLELDAWERVTATGISIATDGDPVEGATRVIQFSDEADHIVSGRTRRVVSDVLFANGHIVPGVTIRFPRRLSSDQQSHGMFYRPVVTRCTPEEQADVDGRADCRVGMITILVREVSTGPGPAGDPPCDDPEVQTVYDPDDSGILKGYHEYGDWRHPISTVICPTAHLACTREAVFRLMLASTQHIAPTPTSRRVVQCLVTPNVNVARPVNPIRTVIDAQSLMVTNYTKASHALHPGRVTRHVIEREEGIFVVTHGVGQGAAGPVNEALASTLWRNQVDAVLKLAARRAGLTP